jgi:DNA-binding response OmpR family regulator
MDSPAVAPIARTGAAARRRLCILVADDDRDTVEMLTIILRDEGHLAYGVYSGAEVLPLARTVMPDAIILDISVPGLSGYAVAREISATYLAVKRPLLIGISGKWKHPSDRMLARQVGFDHHLLKPCEPGEVLRLLEPLRR